MHDQPNATDIRRRTQHGLPLTQEQQRFAVQIAFGRLPPRRKRKTCPRCGGHSVLLDVKELFQRCPNCCGGEIWVVTHDQYAIPHRQCACGNTLPNRCPECEIGDALP